MMLRVKVRGLASLVSFAYHPKEGLTEGRI